MAYHGPVRLSLKGDRVVAARFIRVARVLLWKLEQETRGASARRDMVLPNGVLIEVAIAGRLRLATITVPTGEKEDLKVIEHFVPWARHETLLDGIDLDHPQQMLRTEDEAWRTLFFEPGIDGYDDFERPKGTYRTEDGVDVFPDGVRRAGNVDWRSADGLRVSWYGPSSRYWFDPFVQPRSQYGQKVFMLGHVILDLPQYITDSAPDPSFSETYVLGAALEGTHHLLVVQAWLPEFSTPGETVPANTVVIQMPVTRTIAPISTDVVLCRYALSQDDEEPTKFSVVPGSREVITTRTFDTPFNPFFFNASATVAVSCLPPTEPHFTYLDAGTNHVPQETTEVALVNVEGSWDVRNVSCAPNNTGVVAADWREDTLVEAVIRRETNNGGGDNTYFEFDGRSWPLRSVHLLDPPLRSLQMVNDNHLFYADLRSDTVLLHETRFHANLTTSTLTFEYSRMALYCGASVSVEDYVHDLGFTGGFLRNLATSNIDVWAAHNYLASVPVAPQCFLYYIESVNQAFITITLIFQGRLGGYTYQPWRAEHYFGGYGVFRITPQPLTIIADRSDAVSPIDDQDDFDGHQHVLGCAGFEGAAVASTYAPRAPFGVAANLVTGGPEPGVTLAELTGVEGEKQRYHPIWLLGTLPRTEV